MAEPKKQTNKIVTPRGRLSFPSVFEKRSFDGGKPKFECSLLIPKAEKDGLLQIVRAADQIIRDKFAGKSIPAGIKKGLRDGAEKPDLDGYDETVYFLRASATVKPPVWNAKKETIDDEALVYAGANGRLVIAPFWYDQKGNKGVGWRLLGVQVTGGGEPLGGSRATADDLPDDLPEGDGGDAASLDDMLNS